MLLRTYEKTCAALVATLLTCAANAAAQSIPPVPKTIYNFGGTSGDGTIPYSLSVRGNTVYVGTKIGGTGGVGAVVEMIPPASPGGAWTDNAIYSYPIFCCGEDNFNPQVTAGEDGNVYVITGYGTIFALLPPASPGGAWTQTVTYDFPSQNNASAPVALIEKNGVVYGVAGGGDGLVFSLIPPTSADGAWSQTTLYNFMAGNDGAQPNSLVMDSHGVIYGTTFAGGFEDLGTVFSLTPPASRGGAWTENIIWSFNGGATPAYPRGIAFGADGVLCGASYEGGVVDSDCGTFGCGTVFSLTPPATHGGFWNETTLYSFTGGFDGRYPIANVAIANDGSLWGVTSSSNPPLTVFSLAPPATSGDPWTLALHYSFKLGDGYPSVPGLVTSRKGTIYGATSGGGSFSAGTVFSILRP
ncbi:MAG: choice-of-anchor tandem repeat GloVer-containing protein [Bryobacteraceae bacterium]